MRLAWGLELGFGAGAWLGANLADKIRISPVSLYLTGPSLGPGVPRVPSPMASPSDPQSPSPQMSPEGPSVALKPYRN